MNLKNCKSIDSSFFSGLRYYISLGPPASKTGVLIHGGETLYRRENFVVRPWFYFLWKHSHYPIILFSKKHYSDPRINNVVVWWFKKYLFTRIKEILTILKACINNPVPFLSCLNRRYFNVVYIKIRIQGDKEIIVTDLRFFFSSVKTITFRSVSVRGLLLQSGEEE